MTTLSIRTASWFFSLGPLALIQAGCVQLAEVDATQSPVYRPMIGREFELEEEFLVYGIKLPDQKSPEPAYVVIMPPPGIGGHLTVDLGRLPAGSRFWVVGVSTHRSRLFPSTEYAIAFADPRIAGMEGKSVRITGTAAWKLYVKAAIPDEPPQLSERYFRAIGPSEVERASGR